MHPDEINELRRLYQAGQISSMELEAAESKNALRDVMMPQPRYDVAPMLQNSMRTESGPMAGNVISMDFTQGQAGPAAPKLGEAIEYMGRKGRYSADGRKIVFADGSTEDMHPERTKRLEADEYLRQKRASDLKRSDMEYKKDEAQLNAFKAPKMKDAPAGYRYRADGQSLEAIPGGPADVSTKAEKPMNDEQAKAAGYGQRAAAAHDILDTVGQDGKVQPGLIKRAGEAVPLIGGALGTILNGTQSAEQQQVEQAQRNFINAVLRRESGAVISDDEFDNARKQYFPQPNDDAKVIAQKKANRLMTIEGIAGAAGSGRESVTSVLAKSGRAKVMAEAREAVKNGANPEAVRKRLEGMGIKDPL